MFLRIVLLLMTKIMQSIPCINTLSTIKEKNPTPKTEQQQQNPKHHQPLPASKILQDSCQIQRLVGWCTAYRLTELI